LSFDNRFSKLEAVSRFPPNKKPDCVIWDFIRPVDFRYNHLEVLGRCGLISPLPAGLPSLNRAKSNLFTKLPNNVRELLKQQAGDFYPVYGTLDNVRISIAKMDREPVRLYEQDPYFEPAVDYVYDMLNPAFRQTRILTTEEVLPTIEMGASAGQPYGYYGIRTKRDFYSCPECVEHLFDPHIFQSRPVWKIVPKREWLEASEIMSGKVRTFIVPPVPVVHWGKIIYGHQSELLKMYEWSAYGFNPYQGGTDLLAQTLLRNNLFLMYDVKGWDRLLPILEMVYELRNDYIPDKYIEAYTWLTECMVRSFLLMPDGIIFFKGWGNNSGSPNTTTDNIIAHMFIFALFLFRLYKGDMSRIVKAVCRLFGDDNVSSLPEVDEGVDVEAVLVETFALFGLTLDPILVTRNIEDLEFLGFSFKREMGRFIPKYKVSRLAASFVYDIDKGVTVTTTIQKAWSLTVMSAGSGREVYQTFATALMFYYQMCEGRQDTTIRAYLEMGVPTYEEVMSFYLGLESSIDVSKLSISEDGGINVQHVRA
jgi:hypothetical protein